MKSNRRLMLVLMALCLALIVIPVDYAGLKFAPIRLSGDAVGSPIFTPTGIVVQTVDGKLLTFDNVAGKAATSYELQGASHIAPLVTDTVILTATDNGILEAIDRDRLKRLWIYPRDSNVIGSDGNKGTITNPNYKTVTNQNNISSSNGSLQIRGMASSGSGLFYVIDKTRVLAFEERSGQLRFNYELLSDGGAAGADAERVYVMDGSTLKAISANGALRWSLEVGALYKTKPVVDPKSGWVYVASTKGVVQAIDRQNGEVNWSYSLNGWPMLTPLPIGQHVIIGTNDGRLRALDALNGSPAWTTTVGAAIWGDMTTVTQGREKLVIMTTQAPAVVAVDIDSGENRWTYPLADWASSPSPSADSSQVAVATRDRTLLIISVSPMCTIISPLSGQMIGPYPEISGMAWAWGGAKLVTLNVGGKNVELPVGPSGAFNYSPDLSALKDGNIDIQCLAESKDNREEKDAGVRKSAPTLTIDAQKSVMSITMVDSAQQGETVRVFVRNPDGFDLEQLTVDFAGQHLEEQKSPLELKAPANEGAVTLTINRRGFEPATATLNVVSDKTPLFALIVGAVVIVIIVIYVLFFKRKKKLE